MFKRKSHKIIRFDGHHLGPRRKFVEIELNRHYWMHLKCDGQHILSTCRQILNSNFCEHVSGNWLLSWCIIFVLSHLFSFFLPANCFVFLFFFRRSTLLSVIVRSLVSRSRGERPFFVEPKRRYDSFECERDDHTSAQNVQFAPYKWTYARRATTEYVCLL